MTASPCWTKNGVAVPLARVPVGSSLELRDGCAAACAAGGRLSAMLLLPAEGAARSRLVAVVADDARGRLGLSSCEIDPGESFPSLTPLFPQAQAFERELFEEHGLRPEGHPWLKPLRRHAGAEHPFFRVEGDGIHEVAVGPIHAGVIEPGHFRFQCKGEEVLTLEIRLGWQHRGAEDLLLRSSPPRRLVVAESIAGDTAVGHALAHCTALEGLAGCDPPSYAHGVRGVALELERIANHVGDLGALCNDVGYLPGASWFGRLRGEFLNLLMELSGNRFGRSLVCPGGVRFGPTPEQRRSFVARLERAERELRRVSRQTFDTASIGSRFEQTGVLDPRWAEALGAVGVAARASGCDRDVRRDHPAGIYRFAYVPVSLAQTGDVMARALVRWREVKRSLTFVREQIAELGLESLRVPPPTDLAPETIAVALVEGWRGEIAHVAATGSRGQLRAYKVVDPSFHNWFPLAMALRGQEISDFPLCNKSFNLSYAGHDL